MDKTYFPELPDHLRREAEDTIFMHYIFYENLSRHSREAVCSACGERIYVRHHPDGYPHGIEYSGYEDLWHARHGSPSECPHCGVEGVYKAAGIAKNCYNLEYPENIVIFQASDDGQTVYAGCYTVLASPHTRRRTDFKWYLKAKYIFTLGECYAEIYPYMLYNYFNRYGEMLCTCGWHDVDKPRWSGDKPYEPWHGYMGNPAGYHLLNMDVLDHTFLKYADLRKFLRVSHRNTATHLHGMQYLWWYCHYPSLEIAMRTGIEDPIYNAVYRGTKSHADVDLKARRPWEFYRLNKLDFKTWIACNPNIRWHMLQMIHKHKITGEKAINALRMVYSLCGLDMYDVNCTLEYAQELQFSLKDWLKYFKKDGRSVGTWLDYMGMARRANCLKSVNPFPKDLDDAHNAMIAYLNKKQMEERIAAKKAYINSLCRQYPGVKKICDKIRTKFTYSNDEYCIVVPKGIADIVKEGTKLNHCVDKQDRYIERIALKESFIFFLRRKNHPNTSWYTLEVEPDGTIRQKRTYNDLQNADLDEALPFLEEWQKVVAERLDKADLILAATAQQKRIEAYAELRRTSKRIRDGRLLADVLEADLMINKEVRVG